MSANENDLLRSGRVDAGELGQLERDPTEVARVDEPILGGADYEDVDARVFIDGNEYAIVEYREETDISDMADWAVAEVIPVDHENPPDYDDDATIEVRINVDDEERINVDVEPQSIPEREEMFNQWVTLFTGYVNNFRHKGYNRWHVEFSNFTSDLMYEDVTIDEVDTVVRLDAIVETIIDEVSREPAGVELDNLTEAVETEVGTRMKFHRENEKAADILDELATIANARWWVDSENVFHFGRPDTSEQDGLLSPQERRLRFVTDTDAGWLTPPYRSVVVIADGVVGEEGWGSDHLESNDNPVVTARLLTNEERIQVSQAEERVEQLKERVDEDEDFDEDDLEDAIEDEQIFDDGQLIADGEAVINELLDPVFTYKNKDIKTPEQAATVAESLIEDLAEQLEGGEIEIVGRPDVQLLDVVVMPEHLTPSDEEYVYSVGGVTHIMNPSDGFVTKIEPFHQVGVSNDITQVTGAVQFGVAQTEAEEEAAEQRSEEDGLERDDRRLLSGARNDGVIK